MNVDEAEVVDVAMVEEEFNYMEGEETKAEDEVTIPNRYLVHMVMELLFLNIRYMIKVNINNCPEIDKLQFKNSKVRLVLSMYIPRLLDMV